MALFGWICPDPYANGPAFLPSESRIGCPVLSIVLAVFFIVLILINYRGKSYYYEIETKIRDFCCCCCVPVVMIADLIAAGLQSGWRVLRRPTTPETWGHDIEVPDRELKGVVRLSDGSSVGLTASL